MTGLTTEQCLAAIERHSAGLAEAARGNLSAPVKHCPGWSVADLVWHVTGVQWFWARIAEDLPQEMPQHLLEEANRPPRPETDDDLLAGFEATTRDLVGVLGRTDQSAGCWTWAPRKDVAFITRHQVQEAVVHHWDAAHATTRPIHIDPDVAIDAVEEFLSVSVSSDADPADPPRPAMEGAIWVCACVGDSRDCPTWLITDGTTPGTVSWQRLPEGTEPGDVVGGVPMVGGHADPVDVLLWLYGRQRHLFVDEGVGDTSVLDRFRALTFTD
jgi:uncharacterized protein (TIGR03083 family)